MPDDGREGDLHTLIIDRPAKANALSSEAVEALIAGLARAHADGARVIALRGNGRNLSAGFDFADYEAQSEGDLLHRFVRIETLLQQVARSPCLTVGFAHGRNFGAGVDLFAACRWRVATPDATFRMPGLGFGLVLGTRRFAALVGTERAREVLEGLATFDAEQALAWGFVQRIAPQEAWPGVLEEAKATAGAIDEGSRAMLYRVLGEGRDDADLADLVRSASAPGLKERIRRYLEAQQKARAAASK